MQFNSVVKVCNYYAAGAMKSTFAELSRLKITVIVPCVLLLQIIPLSVSVAIDNDIVGYPEISCLEDRIKFSVRTRKYFAGRIYAKNRAEEPACVASGFAQQRTNEAVFTLPLGICGMKSLRSMNPRGMYYGITVVVSFHPLILTKVDEAFHVKCFFEEVARGVTAELGVSMIPTTEASAVHGTLQCRYSIHRSTIHEIDQGFSVGPEVKFARIGDKILHKWECSDPMYGMVVKNCYVTDGVGQRAEVIDDFGCPIDPILITGIRYAANLSAAYAESHVFKFADRPAVWFFCEIQMCMKTVNLCEGISPPPCEASGRYVSPGSPLPSGPANSYPVPTTVNFGPATSPVFHNFAPDNRGFPPDPHGELFSPISNGGSDYDGGALLPTQNRIDIPIAETDAGAAGPPNFPFRGLQLQDQSTGRNASGIKKVALRILTRHGAGRSIASGGVFKSPLGFGTVISAGQMPISKDFSLNGAASFTEIEADGSTIDIVLEQDDTSGVNMGQSNFFDPMKTKRKKQPSQSPFFSVITPIAASEVDLNPSPIPAGKPQMAAGKSKANEGKMERLDPTMKVSMKAPLLPQDRFEVEKAENLVASIEISEEGEEEKEKGVGSVVPIDNPFLGTLDLVRNIDFSSLPSLLSHPNVTLTKEPASDSPLPHEEYSTIFPALGTQQRLSGQLIVYDVDEDPPVLPPGGQNGEQSEDIDGQLFPSTMRSDDPTTFLRDQILSTPFPASADGQCPLSFQSLTIAAGCATSTILVLAISLYILCLRYRNLKRIVLSEDLEFSKLYGSSSSSVITSQDPCERTRRKQRDKWSHVR